MRGDVRGRRLRRGLHAGARVRGGAAPRRRAGRRGRYRLFDEQGAVLALRSDTTIPIARVVATRYADAEPPLRFCYFAHALRAVERGVGEPREFLQGGIELIGATRARGRGRGARADDRRARGGRPAPPPRRGGGRVAVPQPAERSGVPERASTCRCSRPVAARPGRPRACASTRLTGCRSASASCSCACPSCAAGARCSTAPRPSRSGPPRSRACASCTSCSRERGVADRVIFDLGPRARARLLHRARCSRSTTRRSASRSAAAGATTTCSAASAATLPACGMALDVQRVHMAQAAEEALR